MSSQASWQTGTPGPGGADWDDEFPDQQSVEGLLRRLVQQVEETERRYSDALNDLQGRLDQLSLKTGAARASGASDDSATLDRLHDQVSGLARRFEREAATSLDDFERLGRAVLGGLDRGASRLAFESSTAPLPFPLAAEPLTPASSPYAFDPYEPSSAVPPFPPLPDADRDLSQRLVEMAERLEHSVDSAMAPKTLDVLTARVEAIGRQIAGALAALPGPVSLAPIERVIAAIGHKLDHAESELARIGAIETTLYRLIERVDGQPGQLSYIAAKAATEAARLVSDEAKLDAATAERLDAMHRDLKAMNERSSAAGDRLAGIVEAVHDSLKQLVQQAERSVARETELKSRSAESRPVEATMPFGRATRTESEMEEDLVAAARRAAQAAARRAVERSDGNRGKWTPSVTQASSRTETRRVETQDAAVRGAELSRTEGSLRRGRSLLVISAAVLLVLSAILLYSRLQSKPWPELLVPAAEESTPQPSAPTGSSPLPGESEQAPAAAEPEHEAPAPSPSPAAPDAASNATRDAAAGEGENFTDIAKSSNWPATVVEEPADAASAPGMQETTQAKPAAFQEVEQPQLPPGVVFTVEDHSRAY